MSVAVKICGLRDEVALAACIAAGASYLGFVIYPPSRNAVTVDVASQLGALVPPTIMRVGLLVDATDDEVRAATRPARLDMLQLHGTESPERVAAIRAMTGLPVIKALRLQTVDHLAAIPPYEQVADRLLFDSRIGKEPSGGPINWSLLKGRHFAKPWMLAGGLTAQNLAEAVRQTDATIVDVSSGVEDSPGHKSPPKIREFLAVAGRLEIVSG